jgi:ABC-type branched-subunit amino acid transport system substrate-binding protein
MEADLAFAREIRRQGVRAALVGLVATPMQHFRETLGSDADGFCGPSQWEVDASVRPELGPTSAQFATDFRDQFGVEPEYPAAQACAAGLIAAHCVELAGTLDQEALRTVAAGLDLSTFYGRFRLDPETGQQVGHRLVVVQWRGGEKVVIWPPAPSE